MKPFRYSALDIAMKCQQRYKYQYIDEVPIPGKPSIDIEFGTALHLGLESMLRDEDGEETFKIYWESMKAIQFAKGAKDHAELADLGEIFLARFKRLHLKHFKPKFLEQRMSGSIGPHAFEGTADVVGEYKDIPSVIDFKTSFKEYPKETIIARPQLPLYAAMIKEAFGYEAKQIVYYIFIKSEERIQVLIQKLTPEFLKFHVDNLWKIAHDLKRAETEKSYTKNFNNCMQGSYKCPYFDKCFGGVSK